MEQALVLVAGLVLLVGGAELLVSGAVHIAQRFGVSGLLIGLLVGLGTSTPELVTSVLASLAGTPGIALGNVVGANVSNMLLVLGACALILPVRVDARSLRFDGGVVLGSLALFAVLSALVPLGRPVGALYVALLTAYLVRSWQIERKRPREHTAPYERGEAAAEFVPVPAQPRRSTARVVLAVSQVIGGIALAILGAGWLVESAVDIARALAVSESVIGLTLVALGTTLPELATSVAAARRRNTDVALGNVFGSCIYNVLGIAGLAGLIAPTRVPAEIANFGNPVMVGVALVMLLLAWTGYRISRREGAVMLALYAVYVAAIWRV